jgi:hypothetical protein
VLAEFRLPLEARGGRLVVGAAEYLLQTLCHGLFLFVLPAYYAATTLTSANSALLLLLAAAALLTTIDPWYRTVIHPRPWLRAVVLWLAMFAGLNVAVALLGARPIAAAVGAAGLAALALAPMLRRPGATWLEAGSRAAIAAAVAMTVVWSYPEAVPPAPMFLARAVAARDVADLLPLDAVAGTLDASMAARWGSLAAYTAIYAPAGMRQPIEHVWYRNGVPVATIALMPIMGGRREGFRTFSRHRLREPVAGRYRVDVMTTSGQLLGRLAFTITP